MSVRLILMIRWIAVIVLVLAIILIIARLKLPVPERRSEGILATLRRYWRRFREYREDARAHESDLATLKGKRALLVDPDEKSARVMAWKLESLDCEVVRTRTGMQALNSLQKQAFELAIVDALLPDMSAGELYSSLGNSDMPVVFVGVTAPQYDELRGLGRNVACLSKPYDPEEAAALAGYILSQERDKA